MAFDVLIVDDSPTTRMVIERVVRQHDPDVGTCYHASNGKEALERLQSHRIDFIFADLHMPEMDGRELLRRIRNNDLWRKIPIAIITSESSEETAVELVELGANCYEKKPLTPEGIREALETLKECLK